MQKNPQKPEIGDNFYYIELCIGFEQNIKSLEPDLNAILDQFF